MKKFFTLLFVFITFTSLLPVSAFAKTVNVSFYSDDANLDTVATLTYRLCTNLVNPAEGCTVSEIKDLHFYAMTGENTSQFTITDNQSVIGFELSVNHKKPPYINSPTDLNQACKAVKDGDTLTIQPSTDGIYACNGEMSKL